MELLIGAGRTQEKRLWLNNDPTWKELVTLDWNDAHKPNVVHDLEKLPLPFEDNMFDEIHAYAVLEHTGAQGDWKFFFDQFSDFHRLLKPDGHFFAMVPSINSVIRKAELQKAFSTDDEKETIILPGNMQMWGDPSHKRTINMQTLSFLSQEQYRQQVGKTMMSDFRFHYKADFVPVWIQDDGQLFYFILKAVKDGAGWTSSQSVKE